MPGRRGRPRAPWVMAALALAAATVCGAGESLAQSPEQFYRGRTLDLLVGYAPGGLNDTLSRVVARHIGKKIPGQPNVVVRRRAVDPARA